MPLKIVRNDITKMKVDAIVNTANAAPIYSTGVDTAVYKAAGEHELLEERKKIGYLNEGEVAITSGYKLDVKYIIHAVSPLYINGKNGEEELLRSCYQKSMNLAYEKKCKSMAFPLISTGGFGYPKEEGIRIALDEITSFLINHDMQIYLVVFDAESTRLGEKLYPDLEAYIDQNYVCDKSLEEYSYRNFPLDTSEFEEEQEFIQFLRVIDEQDECVSIGNVAKDKQLGIECFDMEDEDYFSYLEEKESALEERMKHLSDTFQEYLFYLIKQKQLKNVDVYKRAILDKRQFSRIKNHSDYHPDKSTALRLCVGAMLNIDETKDLLARAGYALSPCDKRDIIFSYFIEREIYDVTEIDITLEEHGLPCFIV